MSPAHAVQCTVLTPPSFPPVPPPTLSVGVSAPPYNGTVLSLQGNATLATEVVDTAVTVRGEWRRADSQQPNITSDGFTTSLAFAPLGGGDGGEYVYSVAVEPSNPTFTLSSTANQTFTLEVLPYPELQIVTVMENVGCISSGEMTTLRGSVTSLLLRTATDHTLSYTWRHPSGHVVSSTAGDNTELVVEVVAVNVGDYTLTVCLDIPASGITGHCSSATYTVCILSERNQDTISITDYVLPLQFPLLLSPLLGLLWTLTSSLASSSPSTAPYTSQRC